MQLNDKDLVSEEFCKAIQAAVIYFDISSGDSWSDVKCWKTFIDEYEPEIKMLVCNSLRDSCSLEIRHDVQNWVISNGFELIELDTSAEDPHEDDLEDDFYESNSYLRIRQALQAHPWPNLDLKDTPEYKPSSRFQDLLDREEALSNERLGHVSETTERVDSLLNESSRIFQDLQLNDGAASGGDSEGPSFENLFEKFQEMKEKASSLTGDERKVFAEKTAIAFWKAIGGDEEEIDGVVPENPDKNE